LGLAPELTELKQTLIGAQHEESQADSVYSEAWWSNSRAKAQQTTAVKKADNAKTKKAQERWGQAAAAANQLRGETENMLHHATRARELAKKESFTVAERIREVEAVLNSLEKSELSAMLEVICSTKGLTNGCCFIESVARTTGTKFAYFYLPEKIRGSTEEQGYWNRICSLKHKPKRIAIRQAYIECLKELELF